MLKNLLAASPFVLPNLIVPERVVRAMVEETLSHPPTETGQSLIGLEPDPQTLIVLGILPDIDDTTREPGFFGLGGKDQVEIYRWFMRHWEKARKASTSITMAPWQLGHVIPKGVIPAELNYPLRIVGDWHRHPGLYKVLSPHDRGTIMSILTDPAQKKVQYLTPIAVYDDRKHLSWKLEGDELVVDQTIGQITINWWFSSKLTPFKVHKLVPNVVPNNMLPWLPPISWHLVDAKRMRAELKLLQDAGYHVRWTPKEVNGDIHIEEVVFGIDHPEWKKRLLLVTQWDYPKSLPTFRIMDKPTTPPAPTEAPVEASPKKPNNRWHELWIWLQGLVSRPPADFWRTTIPVVRWGKEIYLIDTVRELHDQLRGVPDEPKQPVG